jgi:hypothetical protein
MRQKIAALKATLFSNGNSVGARGGLESGQEKRVSLQRRYSYLIAALMLSGCVAAYSAAPLPTHHPANPAAPEAPPPPASQVFSRDHVQPVSEEMQTHDSDVGQSALHGGQQ